MFSKVNENNGSSMNTNATTLNMSWTKNEIVVEGLNLSIGPKLLLTKTNFSIGSGDRIALLGRNGCGKSTLFHWIIGQGEIMKKNGISVYEVTQELFPSKISITDVVLSAHLERGELYRRMTELELKNELDNDELVEYEKLGEEMKAINADADRSTVKKILHGLGFNNADMEKGLDTFSGGWRARVALAQGLFMQPDLLLLDEPTNHLDLEGVLWLSAYLAKWKKAFIVISHNMGFVREVASVNWLIENNTLKTYRCNYSRFQKQHELEMKKITADWEKFDKELTKLKSKGSTGAKKQVEDLISKANAEGIVRPPQAYKPKFFFTDAETIYKGYLLKTDNACLGYDNNVVLDNVTFALYGNCRVALVGGNGSGKTTFLRFLNNELEPINGTVDRHNGLKVVKFDQHFYHSLPDKATPIEHIREVSNTPIDQIRKILGSSGLEGLAHNRPIGTLSGGQKARVYFATIASQKPDILLMDEPTNHLDVETIEGLSEGLNNFEGAAIIVSHDLDFLENVATEVWKTCDGQLKKLSDGLDGLEKYVDEVVEAMEL